MWACSCTLAARLGLALVAAVLAHANPTKPPILRGGDAVRQAVAAVAHSSRTGVKTGAIATFGVDLEKSGVRVDLDLSDLALRQTKQASKAERQAPSVELGMRFQMSLANTTLPNGEEVACLNCDPDIFKEWVQDRTGSHCIRAANARDLAQGGKHPGSPGYDKWLKKQEANEQAEEAGASLVSIRAHVHNDTVQENASNACNDFNVTVTYLQSWDLQNLQPRLQHLWATRRLIVYGYNPLHKQMDFVEALVHLARSSPALIPKDCGTKPTPHCGTLLSGLRPAASVLDLEAVVIDTFGDDFVHEHKFNFDWSPAEQRKRVKTLLAALKHSYRFYRQTCLAHEEGDEKCDIKTQAQLVGQIACDPREDEVSDDCMYAEVRKCPKCDGDNKFFEYARFHGPMRLFNTRNDRDWVMGQCEEFSRAGYALLASLGWEARYVLDFTDHVWIEVRLTNGDKEEWIHADPSEGVLDDPKMYERGWGKQLTMIFAFTPWSIDHVTAKYTDNYKATVFRRGVTEDHLDTILKAANDRLKYELPMTKWGYQSASTQWRSADRSLDEIALWSHFET